MTLDDLAVAIHSVYGDQDPVIIPEYLNHVETCFDSIKVETLAASHFVQDEKPCEVAAFINAFISGSKS